MKTSPNGDQNYRNGITPMSKINFSDYAIAFLDILGFKNFIVNAEIPGSKEIIEFDELQKVIRRQLILTSDAGKKQYLFPKAVGLKCISISDSFILSAPFSCADDDTCSGLVAVSIKAIQLAHQLLKMGFLLRGGISVGKVYRTDRNIFGTGYQSAYETESQLSKNPRILLHQSAEEALQDNHHFGLKTTSLSIFMKDGNSFILDTLNAHWSYIGNNRNCNTDKIYRGYKSTIEEKLDGIENAGAREKWEWVARLFNAKVRDSSDLRSIPPIDMDRISPFSFTSIDSEVSFKEAFAPFIAESKYVKGFCLPEEPQD
jgi:hypothetical protein